MTEYATAESVDDFNETEFKKFATRLGERWSFTIPYEQIQSLEDLLPQHVLTVQNIMLPMGELMLGKLVKKETTS
jgi:hypothetical protein